MEQKQKLPNSSAVLVLGILSLVFICAYGIGGILGIIGLALSTKGRRLYRQNPEAYEGYGNLKAGFVMSIIGTAIGSIWLLMVIFGVAALSSLPFLK